MSSTNVSSTCSFAIASSAGNVWNGFISSSVPLGAIFVGPGSTALTPLPASFSAISAPAASNTWIFMRSSSSVAGDVDVTIRSKLSPWPARVRSISGCFGVTATVSGSAAALRAKTTSTARIRTFMERSVRYGAAQRGP